MNWPNFLVEELANRRCVIVTGAGVSLSCATDQGSRPPSWVQLLERLKELIREPTTEASIAGLLKERQYLDAAQVIADATVPEDRERVIKRLLEQPFQPSEWVRICRDLDQNVILTTNYDCILEDACPRNGFRTHIHKDHEAVKVLRSPERLIYKVHGCVRRDPSSMILARSQYHWLRATAPQCLGMLEALFATHTGLFIGYSMSDPDIQLVLQNVTISFPYAQPHVILLEDATDPAVRKALEASLNLHIVTYPRGNHAAGLSLLKELMDRVTSMRASMSSTI